MDTLLSILEESWAMLLEASPFMLLGLVAAGLLKALVSDDFVSKHLGGHGPKSVVKASLFGLPLPLCSCGVLPAAAGLRKQGAGKGATAAFMISTPETGVDSVAVTYALLDPIMTVVRPLAALVTAMAAGFAINGTGKPEKTSISAPVLENVVESSTTATPNCGAGCCSKEEARQPVGRRIWSGLKYAFGDLLGDIGMWFLGGVIVAGFIAALVPDGFLEQHLGSGVLPMLIMLVAGVPLYVCATASTPVAAALALKGLSPGAALVFLLAGPATNVATLAVASRILGKRAVAVYLVAIVVFSLGFGLAVDALYISLGLSVAAWAGGGESIAASVVAAPAAILLLAFLACNFAGSLLTRFRRGGNPCCSNGGCASK
jgi:uncharacterized membrane protein YraQ (UPF0718 family)